MYSKSDLNNTIKNYCGIDLGVRTFMTSFGNNNYVEYNHNKIKLDKLNKEIDILTNKTHVLTYPNLKTQSSQ
jgi:transposase